MRTNFLFHYCRKIFLIARFIGHYIYDLVKTALLIAWDVLTVKDYHQPGFIDVPLDATSDLEISLIANLITFSPGTMVIGLSPDKKTMHVHVMFLEDTTQAIEDIKQNVEKRVLEVLR